MNVSKTLVKHTAKRIYSHLFVRINETLQLIFELFGINAR